MLGVWVVRKHGTAKGNIYIYSYFGMFSEYIHDFEFFFFFFFCLVLGVWMLRKCGKVKGRRFFFFSLICLVSMRVLFLDSV